MIEWVADVTEGEMYLYSIVEIIMMNMITSWWLLIWNEKTECTTHTFVLFFDDAVYDKYKYIF